MKLQIEQGKCYRTRDGRKVGPMYRQSINARWEKIWNWTTDPSGNAANANDLWRNNGKAWSYDENALDIVSEWTDTKTPILWRDMTPEQKGALLLAQHEEKTIQLYADSGSWTDVIDAGWADSCAYRVKPGPMRQHVSLMNFHDLAGGYTITFDVIDGVPDCASVRMEKL